MDNQKRQSRQSKRQFQADKGDRVEFAPNLLGALVIAGRNGLFGKEYVELADAIWKATLTLEEIAYRLQARSQLDGQKKSGALKRAQDSDDTALSGDADGAAE